MQKLAFLVLVVSLTSVFACKISLYEWGFNINGTVIGSQSALPDCIASPDGFFENGVGTLTLSLESAVSEEFSVASFFDYEIDEHNNTFFDEYGLIGGTSDDSRLSYEIDEPGYGNGVYTGDIYDNFIGFQSHEFDGKTFYDGITDTYLSDSEDPVSDDVAMAMGWKFSLNEKEKALVEYSVSTSEPVSGLFLAHRDRDDTEKGIYLQSKLTIIPKQPVGVPEPDLLSLLGISMFFLCSFQNARRKHQ